MTSERFKVVLNAVESMAYLSADQYLIEKYQSGDELEFQRQDWRKEFDVGIRWLEDEFEVELTFPSEQDYLAWLLRWD